MAKQPTPARRPLGAPPHRYVGHYQDRCGAHFCVPNSPSFALYRCDAEGIPSDLESPLHQNEAEFTAALGFGTFTKIVA